MNLTQRHITNETVARAVHVMSGMVESELARRAAIAHTGSSGLTHHTGEYNDDGTFVPYLRLDYDNMDSGGGCGP